MRIHEAIEGNVEKVSRECAVGRIAADFYTVYPPGIPLIVPGERITEDALRQIKSPTINVVAQ